MRKFTFHTHSLKGMYGYGLIYIVAGIFEFMSGELKKGNAIVFLDVTESGQQVECLIQSIDELMQYYAQVIIKASK